MCARNWRASYAAVRPLFTKSADERVPMRNEFSKHALSFALFNHPRALAELDQLVRADAHGLSIGTTSDQQVHGTRQNLIGPV
jgi:hypothetical protein